MISDNEVRYRVLNPATGAIVEEFETATDAGIEQALARAEAGFARWRAMPIADRAAIVARIGALFVERAEELGTLATQEMGKALASAIGEARFCGQIFDYYAMQGPGLAADQPITTFGAGHAVMQKLPIGPVLGVMPWNYPYYQVARLAAPNLVLGNAIVLKHSESCPRSAQAIEWIMIDAGLPDGVYVNVLANHAQVARMIGDRRIAGVSFTGSDRAGAVIGELAGRNLKKAVLELGGSDPWVVLDAEDVPAAAATAWNFRMLNMGQACNSNKRLIVMDDIFDPFVAALVDLARAMRPGDPMAGDPGGFSPLSTRAAAERLQAQVQDAVSQGAVLHVGGTLLDGPGAYFQPAVLTGVTPAMRAWREELFGPVAVVYRVSSDEEAVTLANDTDYGLGGAVFSRDDARARRVADRLESGMANVNVGAGEGAEIPFGGVKRSGFGRELGPLGMNEFANHRLFYTGA
jgi:succinate-semialdehyde dehydrogenase / glutarate-semialdehyde dehydrogenase